MFRWIGAGLGSRLTEEVRDRFGKLMLVNATVAPFLTGETPMQYYNTLLTIATLQANSDAIILLQNADLVNTLITSVHRSSPNASPSLPYSIINSHIADRLCDIFEPTASVFYDDLSSLSLQSATTLPIYSLSDVISRVCPLGACKLMEIHTSSGLTTPQTHEPYSWSSLTDALMRSVSNHVIYDSDENKRLTVGISSRVPALASLTIARGKSILPLSSNDESRIHDKSARYIPHASWQSSSAYSFISSVAPSVTLQPHSISLALNRYHSASYLQTVLSRAQAMFSKRLYIHWYERFQCTQDRLMESFNQVQDIITDYQEFTTT